VNHYSYRFWIEIGQEIVNLDPLIAVAGDLNLEDIKFSPSWLQTSYIEKCQEVLARNPGLPTELRSNQIEIRGHNGSERFDFLKLRH
jgi:hypothetical protein